MTESSFRERYSAADTKELRFADMEIEKRYREEVSERVHQQARAFKHVLASTLSILLIYEIVANWRGSFLSTLLTLSPAYIFMIILIISLQWVSQENTEHFACVLTLAALVGLLLTANSFRLDRLYPREGFPDNNWDWLWMETCGHDFSESARDTMMVGVAMCVNSIFNIFVRVRTKLTLILPMSISGIACLAFPSQRIEDGGNSERNFFLLVLQCWAHWFGSYLLEKQHRQNWALRRQAEESAALEKLIGLMFPVVVLVCDGHIIPAEESTAPTEQIFGARVSNLLDLPEENATGDGSTELERLVDEVKASGLPAKRNLAVRPLGGSRVFQCSVCAVFADRRRGVLVGFDIRESWEIATVEEPQADIVDSSSLEQPGSSDQSRTYDGWGGARLVSANFGELVLGCIEADFCNQGLILQH